jgi:N-glycosylase/DNA lyase
MPEENVEQLHRALEAFNRRDGAGFDALLTLDAEIVPVRAALEGNTWWRRFATSEIRLSP